MSNMAHPSIHDTHYKRTSLVGTVAAIKQAPDEKELKMITDATRYRTKKETNHTVSNTIHQFSHTDVNQYTVL